MKRIIFLIIYLIANGSICTANPEQIELKNSIDSIYYYLFDDIEKSKYFSTKTINLALKEKDEESYAKGLFGLGLYYENIYLNDSALYYFQESSVAFENIKSTKNLASTLNTIAILYRKQNRLQLSKKYQYKSLNYYIKTQDSLEIANQYNNLGNVYSNLGIEDSSFYFYKKSEYIYKELDVLNKQFSIHLNLGIEHEFRNELLEAEYYFKKSLEIAKQDSLPYNLIDAYTNFGYLNIKLKNFTKAEEELLKAKEISNNLFLKDKEIIILEALIIINEENNNYKNAFYLSKELYKLNKEVFKDEQAHAMLNLETNYTVSQQNKEIDFFKKLHLSNKKFYITLLTSLLLLIVIIGFVLFLKIKGDKQKRLIEEQNKKLIELEIKAISNEKNTIEKKLDIEKKYLSNYSTIIKQKNDLINQIIKEINSILSLKENKDLQLKILRNRLKQNSLVIKNMEDLNIHLDEQNKIFTEKLTSQFPKLTKKDILLLSYLKLELSTKEISILTNKTESAIKTAKYRLKAKIDLDSELNLQDFIKTL